MQPTTTPAAAAQQAADQYAENGLAAEDVCLSFNGIGRDYADIDTKYYDSNNVLHQPGEWFPTEAEPHRNDTCFFRLTRLAGTPLVDTDRLPFFTRTSATSTTPSMPSVTSDGNADLYFNFPKPTNFLASQPPDRSYRHPFLINATRSDATLRRWVQDFMRAYVTDHPTLPIPSRLYLDTEPSIFYAGSTTEVFDSVTAYSANAVWILHQLYESRHSTNAAYNYWSGMALPGDPIAGYTLEQRYLAEAARFGLPVIRDGSGNPVAADLENTTNGLQVSFPNEPIFSGASNRNRRFTAFFAEVCNRAIEKVMDNCFYSVLREGLPATGSLPAILPWTNCKVGNYASVQQDGALAPMGIIFDSTCAGSTCAGTTSSNDYNWLRRYPTTTCGSSVPVASRPPEQPNPDTHDFTILAPRCGRFVDIDGGLFWHLNTDENGNFLSDARWGSMVQSSKGTVDSPVLYPLFARKYQYNRIRQPNPYARLVSEQFCGGTPFMRNLLETPFQATLRQMRYDCEAALGGYLAGGGRPLVPWIVMANFEYRDTSFDPPHVFTVSIQDYAQHIAMLRGKRIEDLIVWTQTRATETATAAAATAEWLIPSR